MVSKPAERKDETPISDYGIIGDLHTVALIGMDASIDFMCFPHFDSPSIFAALLDHDHGGYYDISPSLCEYTSKQFYIPDTNILLTRFLSTEGVAEISDFMVVDDKEEPSHQLVRRAKVVRGCVEFLLEFRPRFDYGRAKASATKESDGVVSFCAKDEENDLCVRLISDISLEIDKHGDVSARFTLKAGETAHFIMEDARCSSTSRTDLLGISQAFLSTLNYWQNWVRKSSYQGRWREMVNRSALVLKLLTSQKHGSIVAAPTFGLPETMGGVRNWDYRFTWLRDASFTLYGLIRLGYTDEASGFMNWLEERIRETPLGEPLQVMYGIDGRKELPELELPHLRGYMDSRPVRIGNGAADQLQLDIYGELMDSIYLFNKHGEPIHFDFWERLVKLIDWLCENWNQPDEGIWEVRGGKQDFTYSRIMCWVAVDRAIRLADKRSLPAPRVRWEKTRDQIYYDVMDNCWDEELGAFVQYKGAKVVDAATLIMPLVRFISPTDPRFISTLREIEKQLVSDSLVYRYNDEGAASDGLSGKEGTFCMCTFWYVECLARAGDLDKARFLFEKMTGYANHLGLYAEELGPRGEHLGNFPQAFTHLALISAAFELNRQLDGLWD